MKRYVASIAAALMMVIGVGGEGVRAEDTDQRLQRAEDEIARINRVLSAGAPEADHGEGRLSFHGYGELHYNNPAAGSAVPQSSTPARMDFHRMVWGLTYQYSDRISVHTEVDFEHAANAADLELEFAYLDFLVVPVFNVRAGSMLMPVGPLNEFHEPPLFYSVERPYVQNVIIPTTWQEGGVGIFGGLPAGLKYRVYLVSSLNAEGFSSSSGLRGGRGKVKDARSEDLAVVGRLEYVGIPGLEFGASVYQGGANATRNSALGSAGVGIWEGDIRFHKAGFDLRGVVASVQVDGADQISTFLSTPPTSVVIGDEMQGWYLEGAYDVLRVLAPQTDQSVVVFVRYEDFNTQESVPTGFTASPANDREVRTAGFAYFPIPDIAIKGDVENWKNGTSDGGNRFNLGAAYQF